MQQLNKIVPNGTRINLTDCFGRPFIKEVNNCKYALTCPVYNPTLIEDVTVGVKGYPDSNREITIAGRCVNGGGCACSKWKRQTNKQIGGYDKPQTPTPQTHPHKTTASAYITENKTLDSMEQRLKKLSNMKMETL